MRECERAKSKSKPVRLITIIEVESFADCAVLFFVELLLVN